MKQPTTIAGNICRTVFVHHRVRPRHTAGREELRRHHHRKTAAGNRRREDWLVSTRSNSHHHHGKTEGGNRRERDTGALPVELPPVARRCGLEPQTSRLAVEGTVHYTTPNLQQNDGLSSCESGPGNRHKQKRKRSTTELRGCKAIHQHDFAAPAGLEPATSRSRCEVAVCFTTGRTQSIDCVTLRQEAFLIAVTFLSRLTFSSSSSTKCAFTLPGP